MLLVAYYLYLALVKSPSSHHNAQAALRKCRQLGSPVEDTCIAYESYWLVTLSYDSRWRWCFGVCTKIDSFFLFSLFLRYSSIFPSSCTHGLLHQEVTVRTHMIILQPWLLIHTGTDHTKLRSVDTGSRKGRLQRCKSVKGQSGRRQ